ncbi:MAG: hypothetical protein QXO69_03140 [archaeon]
MASKAKKEDVSHYEQMSELGELKALVYSLRMHNAELEKDIREARTLLYVALAVLMALFGLLVGVALKMIA